MQGPRFPLAAVRRQVSDLPLSITLYEDGDYAGASSLDLRVLQPFYQAPEIVAMLQGWRADTSAILKELGACADH